MDVCALITFHVLKTICAIPAITSQTMNDRTPGNNQGGGGKSADEGGRTFYYNALTLEGTYEEPPEWRIAAPSPPDDAYTNGDGYMAETGNLYGNTQQPESLDPYGLSYGGDGGVNSNALVHRSYGGGGGGGVGGLSKQGSVPTVQSNWSTHFDETAGLEYYVNDLSGESTYERPPELTNGSYYSSQSGNGNGGGHGGGVGSGGMGGSGTYIQEWTEQWDDQAQARYWFNSRTQEATWTQPPDFSSSVQSIA